MKYLLYVALDIGNHQQIRDRWAGPKEKKVEQFHLIKKVKKVSAQGTNKPLDNKTTRTPTYKKLNDFFFIYIFSL